MKNKLTKRLSLIGANTISNIISPATGIVISILVIRLASDILWGQMVAIMLWVNIAAHVAYFGNKEFLLRQFSLEGKSQKQAWSESFSSRVILIVASFFLPFLFPFSLSAKIGIMVLLVARFVYQSYDVILLFQRRFYLTVLLEILGFVVIAGGIVYFNKALDITLLIYLFTGAEILKAILCTVTFRKEFFPKAQAISFKFFIVASPFFILGFSGMLQSKTDLICVSALLPAKTLGHYQVLMNFFLMAQAGSAFIVAPFIKNIYRLSYNTIKAISVKLFVAGIGVCIVTGVAVYFIIKNIYHLDIEIITLLFGGLFILPIYYYLPLIYKIYKDEKQNLVIVINVTGIIISALLNLVLIPRFENGINGALLAVAITQMVLLFLFIYISRRKI